MEIIAKNSENFFEMSGSLFWIPPDSEPNEPGTRRHTTLTYADAKNVHEPKTTALVEEILKEGDIAVDVGASIGYFTMLFAKIVGPKGKVFCFEPTPHQFPCILRNIKINGYQDRVIPINMAAWNKKEKVDITPLNKFYKGCQATTVDEVLKEHGVIDKIDLIKTDVDGSEYEMLQGLTETFEKSPNIKMIFEYLPSYIKQAGHQPEEVMGIINKYFTHTIIGDYLDRGEELQDLYCQKK